MGRNKKTNQQQTNRKQTFGSCQIERPERMKEIKKREKNERKIKENGKNIK